MTAKKASDDEIRITFLETGSKKKTAEILGMARASVQQRLKNMEIDTVNETLDGLVKSRKPIVEELPPKGQVFRYLITSAQNNTKINEAFWENLLALSDYYAAPILVSQFTYNKNAYGASSVKPGTHSSRDEYDDIWYDPVLDEHICNDRVQLAPGLLFVGDMNVLPTATNPLSALESFTGRSSGIFPHAKIVMESVASHANESTKFNYTTGAVTRRNYIQKKTGQKAEFHHAYGALIVEVEHDGSWWVRQINADGHNRIADLDLFVEKGEVTENETIEVFTPGDIHAAEIDYANAQVVWGKGGVVDTLRPKHQFLHDLFSMRSRSHHEMKSFHRMMEKHLREEDSVEEEVAETVRVCNDILCRPWMKSHVVHSNHDDHLYVWLDRFDYRSDYINSEFFLECQLEVVRRMKKKDTSFNLLEWVMKKRGLKKESNVSFLSPDDTFITCKRYGGGIENALHGDKGPNGARGSRKSLAKMARKLIIGHSHSAGITDGVYQTGTASALRLPYTSGPSSWSHTHCLTYKNGKRALITVWNGKAWADR